MDSFATTVAAATLAEGKSITLPGCGTLSARRVPARIDHGAKTIAPPSLELDWSEDADPGAPTLADILITTGADAEEAARNEHAAIARLLGGGEIVIGDLGRLVKVEESNEIEFIADHEGLSQVYWQGGAIALETLDRSALPTPASLREVGPDTDPAVVTEGEANEQPVVNDNSWQAVLAVVACVLIGLGLWAYVSNGEGGAAADDAQAVTVSQERLNKSPREVIEPAREGLTAGAAPDASPDAQYDAYADVAPDADDDTIYDAAAFDPASLAGAAPDDESAYEAVAVPVVIVVGSFGAEDNATRLAEKLSVAGYAAYVDKPAEFTRVGVAFDATSEEEIATMLQQLRAEYNPRAWVLE